MWQTDYIKLAILTSCFKVLFIPAYRSTDFEVHRNWLAITHSLPVNAWYKDIQTDTQTLNDTHKNTTNHQITPNSNTQNTLTTSSKSEWTLDYPPLFAIMEFLLSQLAYYADANMLNVENLNYASYNTIAFQRLSVVFTDVVFLLAVYGFAKYFSENVPGQNTKSDPKEKPKDSKNNSKEKPKESINNSKKKPKDSKNNSKEMPKDPKYKQDHFKVPLTISLLFLTNSSLFIVDHIHFQYNGILFGILLLSILKIYRNNIAQSAFLFSLLLCMKHIFLYIAPVYGVYMLKKYCVLYKDGSLDKGLFIKRFLVLSFIVAFVFIPSFLPFILMGQSTNLISRLFPFQRGLSHAYWAPNFWALYNSVDKVLYGIFRTIDKDAFSFNQSEAATMTGGRVQEFRHHVLPSIKPSHTFFLSLLFMMPSLRVAWKQSGGHVSFTKALILCAFTSFLFGWHVHEKAILIVTIPLTLLAVHTHRDAHTSLFLHCIANVSIFPLLFNPQEQLLKYSLSLSSISLSFVLLIQHHKPAQSTKRFQIPFMTSLESLYLIGLLFLELYTSLVHFVVFKSALPFLPLLLTSLYCSLGVVYSYVRMTLTYE